MLKKAYLEISNVCNLSCSFCHGTKRPHHVITEKEFSCAAKKIRELCEYLYFHLLGEPLLHPELEKLLEISKDLGFKVIITTNGTLLKKRGNILIDSPAVWKVSVSLHSFEAGGGNIDMREYLEDCLDFCTRASEKGKICVLRLWNRGGADTLNDGILSLVREYFSLEWKETYSGYKLADRVFLEWGEKFDWPDMNAPVGEGNISCYGLRDQIGVLCDGTVVPCCLDAEGDIPLGNIFEQSLSEILESEKAKELRSSFERRRVSEPLCLRCGYARMKKY